MKERKTDMSINELNRIQTINIEKELENIETNSGTFAEILDKVYKKELIPITNNNGDIIGISVSSNVGDLIQDNIELEKFRKKYAYKDVMGWTLKALDLYAKRKEICDVIENDEEIKVLCEGGEEVLIEEKYRVPERAYREELPEEVKTTIEEICDDMGIEMSDYNRDVVKMWLRDKYDHYLAGGYNGMEIFEDYENEDEEEERVPVIISNIKWGRKR